jgi:hypothetical protein
VLCAGLHYVENMRDEMDNCSSLANSSIYFAHHAYYTTVTDRMEKNYSF